MKNIGMTKPTGLGMINLVDKINNILVDMANQDYGQATNKLFKFLDDLDYFLKEYERLGGGNDSSFGNDQ